MNTMQARPRFIHTLLTISATAIIAGCVEDRTEDPLAAVAAEFQKALSSRQTIRGTDGGTDGTAESLRQLASRAQSAGRNSDARAAAILITGIRSSAAAMEFDEAMRAESQAVLLRDQVRSLAANADLLASAADAAESIDLGDTNLMLEQRLAEAREQLDVADSVLTDLQTQTEVAQSQRDESLAEALELEQTANDFATKAADTDPISAQDLANGAAHFREQSHLRRIDAARQEISILNIAPTLIEADTRRAGASETVDTAREARRAAENSVEEARNFAEELRRLLDDLAAGVTESLDRINVLESEQVLPRLEASIADFEAAASGAQPLTRGGNREDAAAGWITIANAQIGKARAQWEIATVQGRRADLFARLSSGGVLADRTAMGRLADTASGSRADALQAAEATFNEALSSLSNIQGDDGASRIRASIEQAIAGLKGASMVKTAAPAGGGSFAGNADASSATSGGSGGAGFGSPAEAANFLSDSSNSLSPAAFKRMQGAMRATTSTGKAVEKLLSAAGLTLPLIEALSAQFGEADVMAAFADGGPMAGGMGGMSMDALQSTFKVDSVDGDTAVLKSSNGSQSLSLVKTNGGWVVDLDATVEADPNTKMMVQMMGPMMEQMLTPLRTAVDDLAKRVNDGEFDSLDDAMAAIEEAMSAAQPRGGAGGFPGF